MASLLIRYEAVSFFLAFQENSSYVSSGVPSDTAEEQTSLSLPRINLSVPARSVNAPSDLCVVATSAISTQDYNSNQSIAFPPMDSSHLISV